ncbi:putative F-box protein At4g29970 [Arachis duranensis]|uniref:F-box protein At4g29970 n=1 Tax=Arachis duranensis TaxID=130453 RepID=A0A6P4D461_ARADU|nr:putative F-box protein At4g29970 [Arachis duranensis]
MEKNKGMSDVLPLDVIRRIFLRLPAKELFRLRCVSKLWHSLISDRDFAESHLNHSSVAPSHSCLFVNFLSVGYFVDDDYLVVLAWDNGNHSQFHVDCFSLRTNSWISFDAALPKPFGHKMWESRGLFLHGAIHWLSCYGAYMNAILIFDLKEWSFSTTSIPVKHYNWYSDLTLLGGCLALFSYDHIGKTYIWVMKEYKVTPSWILMYSIPCFKIVPLSLSNGSDIIALLSTTKLKFAKYNVSGELLQEIDYPPLCYRPNRNFLTFFVYTESLLPFPADTKDKDKKKKTRM